MGLDETDIDICERGHYWRPENFCNGLCLVPRISSCYLGAPAVHSNVVVAEFLEIFVPQLRDGNRISNVLGHIPLSGSIDPDMFDPLLRHTQKIKDRSGENQARWCNAWDLVASKRVDADGDAPFFIFPNKPEEILVFADNTLQCVRFAVIHEADERLAFRVGVATGKPNLCYKPTDRGNEPEPDRKINRVYYPSRPFDAMIDNGKTVEKGFA
jgi:hypothetical protein